MQSSDTEMMEVFTQKHGLWPKRASEGSNSLMRAVSNGLYFTDNYCDEIQGRVLDYFLENRDNLDLKFLELNDEATIDLFLQNPSLPEFEHANLELISRIFNIAIKFYFIDKNILCGNLMAGSFKKKIKILKLFDNHYEYVIPIAKRQQYILAQNVVLSIVQAALDGSPFHYECHNEGRFINIEYENWKLRSGITEHEEKVLKVDYKQNFYANIDRSFNAVYSSQNNSENYSQINESSDSVGSIIVSIMERRRKIKAVTKAKRSIERKFDMLINSSDQQSIKVADTPASELKPETFPSNPGQEKLAQIKKVDPEQCQGFQNFSTKIYGMGTNLNKSVSILELSSIFGVSSKTSVGQQVAPFAFANPVSDFHSNHTDEHSKTVPQPTINASLKPGLSNETKTGSSKEPRMKKHKLKQYLLEQHLDLTPGAPHRSQEDAGLEQPDDLASAPTPNKESENLFNHVNDQILDKAFGFSLNSGSLADYTQKKSKLKEQMRHKRIEEFKLDKPDLLSSQATITSPSPRVDDNLFEKRIGPETNTSTPLPAPPLQSSPARSMELATPSPELIQYNPLQQVKPKYIENRSEKEYTGTLKFFDEKNGFGFMTVREEDSTYDVFVYRNEFKRAKIPIEVIRPIKSGAVFTFCFQIATYMGKSSECKKAVKLNLIETALPTESN